MVTPFSYPHYKQCAPWWGSDVMEVQTVCEVGCLMTSVSNALAGRQVTLPRGVMATPGTLNAWLRANGGYASGTDDLEESAVVGVDPRRVQWLGAYGAGALQHADVARQLDAGVVLVAWVRGKTHFVLATGYSTDPAEEGRVYVHDSAFATDYYELADIDGWRAFLMM